MVRFIDICPDCGLYCEPPGMHQHQNGEWIDHNHLRMFSLFIRWMRKENAKNKTNLSKPPKV